MKSYFENPKLTEIIDDRYVLDFLKTLQALIDSYGISEFSVVSWKYICSNIFTSSVELVFRDPSKMFPKYETRQLGPFKEMNIIILLDLGLITLIKKNNILSRVNRSIDSFLGFLLYRIPPFGRFGFLKKRVYTIPENMIFLVNLLIDKYTHSISPKVMDEMEIFVTRGILF